MMCISAVTAAGTPIKHASFVSDFISACEQPTRLAVVKVKAHCCADTAEAQGNAMADSAARVSVPTASDSDTNKPVTQQILPTLMYVQY